MKTLDITFYFGFDSYYTAEDEATDIDFSDALYEKLKEIYSESGNTDLVSILDTEELPKKLYKELKKIVDELRTDLIDVQSSNGDDVDPDTGEEYDFSQLMIQMEIVIPEEWDE